jgi:hypothetical protein
VLQVLTSKIRLSPQRYPPIRYRPGLLLREYGRRQFVFGCRRLVIQRLVELNSLKYIGGSHGLAKIHDGLYLIPVRITILGNYLIG